MVYYILYIRNIKEQVSDKIKIKTLNVETKLLKEKVENQQFNYIIGSSEPIRKCFELVNLVAPTDANVLIQGETGTGKELFAKAVHDASLRNDKPMITLNCAALPSDLIESELFGHVKGAFTGAVNEREGRFLLADKSSLFLDEIAELSLALQAKLLRVIQEGTFEPVGSSETKHVDVRIIAATHRDLKKQVEGEKFREDLYYRLNVVPISIPPLRDRGSDISLLANAFFNKFNKNRALSVKPFSKSDLNKLQNYHWPGNVRELQNIIERSIITNQKGVLNLEGLFTESSLNKKMSNHDLRILTFEEIQQL
jgi:transcriptional regulator with GAF, ATPase, and Fis domain